MPRAPFPAAYKALQRQLGKARDEETRDRVLGAMRYVGRLYNLSIERMPQDDGDMRRRKVFTRGTHRLSPRTIRDPFHERT
jgi:hypothetical protein